MASRWWLPLAALCVLSVLAASAIYLFASRDASSSAKSQVTSVSPPELSNESLIPEQARRMIQRAADDCRDNPTSDGFITLGLMYHGNGLTRPARECYEIALTLGADDAQTPYRLGLILLEDGRYDEAAAHFRESIARRDDYPLAHHHLGRSILQGGAERFGAAISAMRRAVELDRNDPVLHTGLGKALRLAGRLDEAESALRQALSLDPDHLAAHQLLGLILHERGRSDEAAKHLGHMRVYNATVYNDPWMWEAHRYAASVDVRVSQARDLMRFGRPERAVARLTELAQAHPEHAGVHRALGEALSQTGDHQRAVNALDRAAQLDASDGTAHEMIAQILFAHELFEKAEVEAERALEIDPDLLDAMVVRGAVALRQGRAEDAVDILSAVMERRPSHFTGATFLGEALIARGRYDEAIEVLRRATGLRHGPDAAYAMYQHGIALARSGRFDDAAAILRDAAALQPENEVIASELAAVKRARQE